MKKIDKRVITSLMAVAAGLLAGAILILISGHDPVAGYYNLFRGGLITIQRIGNSLALSTTLILTGLSVAFAFRTGLFNIGAAGQMLIGGLSATVFALFVPAPRFVMIPCVILAALLGGAVWGAIPGFLKALFNVNEVVGTIMMNWIAYWIVSVFVRTTIPESEYVTTVSRPITGDMSLRVGWLTNIFSGSFINIGLFIAVIAAIVIHFLLNKTTLGFELKSVGFNRHGAEYAGIPVNRSIVLAMTIAGGLAGLAGVTFYLGYQHNMQVNVLPPQGYDGIAISLLGLGTPAGVVISAIFFGIMQAGKNFMSAQTQIPPEIADTIIAVIIYFAATAILMRRLIDYLGKRRRDKKPIDIVKDEPKGGES
ncbi:MAG: ABC transporter permease [Oscillospiraceae bacterium]|nr:ABC transporter permease [Oscillospiraceae bacterium]